MEHQVVLVLGLLPAGAGWFLRFADVVGPSLLGAPVGPGTGVCREGVFFPLRTFFPEPRVMPRGSPPFSPLPLHPLEGCRFCGSPKLPQRCLEACFSVCHLVSRNPDVSPAPGGSYLSGSLQRILYSCLDVGSWGPAVVQVPEGCQGGLGVSG